MLRTRPVRLFALTLVFLLIASACTGPAYSGRTREATAPTPRTTRVAAEATPAETPSAYDYGPAYGSRAREATPTPGASPTAVPSPPGTAAPTATATATAASQPAVVEVEVFNFGFRPAEITISPGTTVIWINTSPTAHTVTDKERRWDSGIFGEGERFQMTFETPGEYEYWCLLHPDMEGKVIVR